MNISTLDKVIGPLSGGHLPEAKHMLGIYCSGRGSRKRPGMEIEVGKSALWTAVIWRGSVG